MLGIRGASGIGDIRGDEGKRAGYMREKERGGGREWGKWGRRTGEDEH